MSPLTAYNMAKYLYQSNATSAALGPPTFLVLTWKTAATATKNANTKSWTINPASTTAFPRSLFAFDASVAAEESRRQPCWPHDGCLSVSCCEHDAPEEHVDRSSKESGRKEDEKGLDDKVPQVSEVCVAVCAG